MQRLVIPVSDDTAAIWQNATPEGRAQIIQIFSWLLESKSWQNITPSSFAILMDEISEKAIARGLTPEILEEILHES